MVFQLNAQIPIAYRGFDYGRSQQNALRSLQMQAAEREVDEQNALAAALRGNSDALTSDDPSARAAAAAALARTGTRGYQIAAPVLEAARNEREFAAIRGRFGGGAQVPVAPAAMPGAGAVRTGATIAVPAELDDADILARTLLGEAANQGEVGQRAVAAVVRNRMRQTGRGVRDVVLAPAQFTPWGHRREELLRISPTDPRYVAARRIAEQALAEGEFDDPTGGATHFINPVLQRANGDPMPSWAPEGQGRRIGAHVFYTPGGAIRVGQASGAPAAGGDVVPASAQGGEGPRMPGMPTPQQFAELVDLAGSPNPRVARWAQAQVQTWAPFMRRETGSEPLETVEGQDGRPTLIPRSQAVGRTPVRTPPVQVNMPPGEGVRARADAAVLPDVMRGANDARQLLALLDRADRAVRATPEGQGAQLLPVVGQAARALGIDIQGTSEAEVLRSITNGLAVLQRAPGSGATTDFEMRLYMQAVPRLGNTRDGNLRLIDMGRRLARRRLEEAEIFRRHVGEPDLMERLNALPAVFSEEDQRFLTEDATPAASRGPGGRGTAEPPAPARPRAVPAGSAYSPSRNMWRAPDGRLFNADGTPAQ